MNSSRRPEWVLAAAVAILLVAMGVRATFGLFLQPMSVEQGWTREVFSLAFAIQSIVWGIGAPAFGAMADRYGAGRTVVLGTLLYAAGLAGMAHAQSPSDLYWTAGVLCGLGQSGTTFGVVLGVVARNFSVARRSTALGIASAGGSMGQFLMVPFGQQLIAHFDWYAALLVLSSVMAFGLPLAYMLRGKADSALAHVHQSLGAAFREAVGTGSYHYLFWSFFVCGFHTAFITLHLPSYVMDRGLTATHGALAIALIGLFNVFGSYGCGWLGGRYSKKNLLVWVYGLRSVFIALLLIFPLTPIVLYAFAAGMGLLWLGTVPLTNGLIGQIYGLRYASTLYGIVFLGHQIGGFVGVWLGGYVFETTGSYDLIWWLGIGLAFMAAALSWPIDERSMARPSGTPV